MGMPGTRAQSHGKAVGGTSDIAAGNLPADSNPGLSADSVVTSEQGNMSEVVPRHLQDSQIRLLRASVTKARKDLDDITAEIEDQVILINTAVGKDTPVAALMQFKKSLMDLLENGDKL